MIIIAVDICEMAIFDSYKLDFYGSISYFSIVLRNIMLHSNDIMPVWIYCQIVALPVLAVYAKVGIDLVLYQVITAYHVWKYLPTCLFCN
jgi:hypothetical protein